MRAGRSSSMSARLPLLTALAMVSVGACTNQKLVPVKEGDPPVVDDLVDIEAHFCTRPSEDVAFPVKLLLVVDGSGSMQFTDQPGLRVNAVRQLMNTLQAEQNVQVATMGFGSNVYLQPEVSSNPDDPLFIPASQWTEPDFLTLKDVMTDYQGAFSAIEQHLLRDMLKSDAAELARTKYVVVFFSDGSPSPRCCISTDETVGVLGADPYNCPLEPWEVPVAGRRYCEDEAEFDLCNESDFLDQFRDGVDSVVGGTGQPDYGDGVLQALNDLELEGNYNRSYQIEALAEDIMKLGADFGVGQIQINTALLFDSTLDNGVKEIFRLNRCRSESLLRRVAEIGEGQFRDFENAGEIDFLQFNFTSLKQGFTLISSFATNSNTLPPGGDPAIVDFPADSDGDGLSDEVEFELGTDATVADSDKQVEPISAGVAPDILQDPATWGDGFDDGFEQRRASTGFDPKFQRRPVQPCLPPDPSKTGTVDRDDLDGDGLNGCEEDILGTNVKLADTDGDTLSDGLEARLGLDPTRPEGNRDDDFDGVPNLDEVRKGTDPNVPDADRNEDAVRYELIQDGRTEDGRDCYTSIARGVHLTTTLPRFSGGRRGYNDLNFWIAEAPIDNPTGRTALRKACFRAQYVKPSFKDPAQGKIVLHEEDFVDLNDPATIEAIRNGDDLCVGLAVQ
jgi:hypothetical protein